MSSPPVAIPAATLIVIRDRIGRPPDLLMVERARTMAFAGGALVFPGGRIDPGDEALAALLDAGDDGAARVAAIRETIEEAGIAIGLEPPPSPLQIALLRRRLHAGDSLAVALDGTGLRLALDQLHAFTRWVPAHRHTRIFDTRFFLARATDAEHASVDHTENVRLLWAGAAQLLADAAAGAATIIFPTRRVLERLAGLASFADALADARRYPPVTITPYVEQRRGVPHLCIPEGVGYPVTAEPLSATDRG